MSPQPPSLRRIGRLLWIAGVVAVLAALMLWLGGVFRSGRIDPGRVPPEGGPTGGRTVPVQELVIPLKETFEGTITSLRTTLLAARVGAPVVTLEPRVGDLVEAGRPYGSLETSTLEAEVAITEAAREAAVRSLEAARTRLDLARERRKGTQAELELSRAEHERIKALIRTGAATVSERDVQVARLRKAETAHAEAVTGIELAQRRVTEAESKVDLRERELQLARTNLGYAELKSSVDGRVVRRILEPGSFARPGQPILEIYDSDDLRLEVPVRESLVPELERDRDYTVRLPALDRQMAARIVEVVPSAETGSRTIRVRFALPETGGLYPGMSGSVELEVGRREVLVVPLEAVRRTGQLTFVRVERAAGSGRRWVRLGDRLQGGLVEVLDGLEPGDAVVMPAGASDER